MQVVGNMQGDFDDEASIDEDENTDGGEVSRAGSETGVMGGGGGGMGGGYGGADMQVGMRTAWMLLLQRGCSRCGLALPCQALGAEPWSMVSW